MLKENCCTPSHKNEEESKATKMSNNIDCGCNPNEENCCDTDISHNQNNLCCTPEKQTEILNSSDCSCDCDCNSEPKENVNESQLKAKEFDITIDGKKVKVTDASMNIVEVAKTAGITIPAPCFFNKKKSGCCKVCVVEIDSKQTYACATKAREGMNITFDREDLKAIRKDRLLKYKEAIKNNEPLKCKKD